MARKRRGRPKGSSSRRRSGSRSGFNLKLKKGSIRSIASIVFLCFAVLTTLSYVGQSVGPDNIIQGYLNQYFGFGAVLIPVICFVFGLYLTGVKWGFSQANVWVGLTLFQASFITLVSLFQEKTNLSESGQIGYYVAYYLGNIFSHLGAVIIMGTLLFISLLITLNASITEALNLSGDLLVGFLRMVKEGTAHLFERKEREPKQGDSNPLTIKNLEKGRVEENENKEAKPIEEKKEFKVVDPTIRKEDKKAENLEGLKEETVFANLPVSDQVWEYPPLSLLSDKPPVPAERGDIKQNAYKIEKALESFGIKAKVVEVNCGPTVTQYALELTEGTKIAKVTSLSNDLALALAAPTGTVRIEAPIPGRSLVGIEVPNFSPTLVSLKNTLQSDVFRNAKSKLSVILGHNVSGQTVVDDITKMPHVLIAGSTGSGKTVCVNSLIASLLFQNAPHEIKFIMVDPKRVELVQYNGIPQLLTPVITEADKVLSAMRWSVAEMERRYKLFQKAKVRNIGGYNELSGFQAMPYIVIVVDELADLMMFAPKDFEAAICRIAQMARATGIHLVLATQRPSVDVITGLIKANIPCRIAFNVTSSIDSRVILDQPGAEKLLGKGDMLYLPPDKAKPQRIQGVYVADEELKALQDFLKEKGASQVEYHDEVTEFASEKTSSTMIDGTEPEDDLFEEAVKVIVSNDKASASLLQRRLRVGYARAARLLDQMEQRGVVGPADGAKPRDVLINSVEDYLGQSKGTFDSDEEPVEEDELS